MGLLGIRRKPWKDTDPKKRLQGVMEVPRSEQGTLLHLATQDDDSAVRQAAARRIKLVSYLERLLKSEDPAVVGIVRERLASVAVAEIKKRSFDDAAQLLKEVTEQSALTEIVLQADDARVRDEAFTILSTLDDPSPSLLSRIAIQIEDEARAKAALALVDKRQQLKDVAKKAKLDSIRVAAQEAIDAIRAEQNKPSPEKQRRARRRAFHKILEPMQVLNSSTQPEKAAEKLAAYKQDWQGICDTYNELDIDERAAELIERFERLCDSVNKRIESLQQEAADAAARVAELEACCAKWEERRRELGDHVDAATLENLADAAHAEWETLDGSDSDLQRRFHAIFSSKSQAAVTDTEDSEAAAPVVELNDADRARVEGILEEADALIEAEEWREADYRYKELHKEWSQLTVDLPFEHPLRKGFHDAYVAFKNKCFERREERRQLMNENLKVLESLLLEAETLADAEPAQGDLKQHFDKLQDLQQRWRNVKPVAFKAATPLRKKFRAFCDTAYVPLREYRQEQEWKNFANISVAEDLTERARALLDADPDASTLEEIKALQREWKEMGHLPRERQEELWLAFKSAADDVFQHLQPLFEERDKERQQHYEDKQQLIEELLDLADSDAAEDTGPEGKEARKQRLERVKTIQQEWKTIGPVPRDLDQEQWQRYKKILDSFFGRRRKEFEHIAEEQTENLHQKLALIAEAADLAEDAEAWKAGDKQDIDEPGLLREVRSLQQSWKQAGHVPKDKIKETWNAFKANCDRVYAVLQDWFAQQDEERQENLNKKLELLKKIEAYTKEPDPTAHREDVKAIQAVWRTIGYIPREKLDEVMGRYQELCNIVFNVTPAPAAKTETEESAPAEDDAPARADDEAHATDTTPDESPRPAGNAPAEESTSAGEPEARPEEKT